MMSDTGTRLDLAGSRPSGHGVATAHRQLVGQHYRQHHYVHHYVDTYVDTYVDHYVHHHLMHCLVHGPKVSATANAQLDGPKLDPCDDVGSVL